MLCSSMLFYCGLQTSLSTLCCEKSLYIMRLQHELCNRDAYLDKFTNTKGVKYVKFYVLPLLTASIFHFSIVCTGVHKQMIWCIWIGIIHFWLFKATNMQVLEYGLMIELMRYWISGVGLFEGMTQNIAKWAICSPYNRVETRVATAIAFV